MEKLDNFYCLSIKQNRFDYTNNIFKKYGLPELKLYPGFTTASFRNSEMCCLFGHMSFTMIARYLNLPYYFFFEDDAYPRDDVKEKLLFYINNRPSDCGILVLGENGEYGKIDNTYPNYHIVLERPFGAHAYMVFRESYDELISSFEKTKIADIALRGLNFTKYKPYWTNEYLFIQKNIDRDCMSKNLFRGHNCYFYPRLNGAQGLGIHHSLPPGEHWK